MKHKFNLTRLLIDYEAVKNVLPDQMFHILVQASLIEKQLKFGINRKTIVFFVVLNPLKLPIDVV